MANLRRTVLGIEINPAEIRLVEMRGGNPPHILKAGTVPMSSKAMDGERIIQVEAVADLIRNLHNRLGCNSKAAVVGMGVQSIVTRVLDIPRVPDSELRFVLEGELAHYQILRAGTGAFDFFRLNAPSPKEEGRPSVLLMAVEERIAQGYRLALERAGLQLLALEPVTVALYRAAFPILQNEPAALCLAITPQRSDLSILDHADIKMYRRIEMGSNDVLRGRRTGAGRFPGPLDRDSGSGTLEFDLSARQPTLLTRDDDDTDELEVGDLPTGLGRRSGTGPLPPFGEGEGKILPQAAAAFANEVERSLNYYQREFPEATAINRILVPTNDPEIEELCPFLASALKMEVRIVELPTDPNLPPPVAAQLQAPQGLKYLGALGLAYHALMPDWNQVPRFHLAPGGQAAVPPVERDRVTQLMIASVCILVGGIIFGLYTAREGDIEAERLALARRTLQVEERNFNDLARYIEQEQTLDWIVKSDNLPATRLLDVLTNAPRGVGLTNLNVEKNGRIVVEGKARDKSDFNIYYFDLSKCPYLFGTRYTFLNTDESSQITSFRIESSLWGTQAALGSSGQN
jgi:Tfp pilus assembly PilM family ATPase